MPEVSRRRPTIFSFQDDPPEIAYLSQRNQTKEPRPQQPGARPLFQELRG
jgi:hypothetical protein